jgi:hypothetical protein
MDTQQLENAVKVVRSGRHEVTWTEESSKEYREATDILINLAQSLLSYEGNGMPEKLEEYTDDHNKTNGIYSHSENGKRYFDIDYNQGHNACRQQFILWLQARMPSELDIEKIVKSLEKDEHTEEDISDMEARGIWSYNKGLKDIAQSISALLKERLGMK